ncbi:MAG: WYL domain-containing protein, partial [Ruminococcus sp.]|nr:WYL domain-containing protein [Candidatus Copronaster equi]
KCSNTIIDEILEKFGDKIPMRIDGDSHFIFKAKVDLSNGLVSWITQYGGNIKVLEPKELAQAVQDRAQEILAAYEYK